MDEHLYRQLSRRERQIMDIVFQAGEITAADLEAQLPDPPSNSSIRVLLRILEEKGHLKHRTEKGRYIYFPAAAKEEVKKSALLHLLKTFFGGSAPQVVSTLLKTGDLSQEELDELAHLIEEARKEGGE
jgi:BlaI family transcriptional regulator, penicillinase repressor